MMTRHATLFYLKKYLTCLLANFAIKPEEQANMRLYGGSSRCAARRR